MAGRTYCHRERGAKSKGGNAKMQECRITKRTTASLTGYAILLGIGFLQYFLLSGVNNTCEILKPYGTFVASIREGGVANIKSIN